MVQKEVKKQMSLRVWQRPLSISSCVRNFVKARSDPWEKLTYFTTGYTACLLVLHCHREHERFVLGAQTALDFSSSGIMTNLTSIFSDPEWAPWPLLPHITSLALYTTGTACLSLDSVLQQVLSWLCGVDSPWGSIAGIGRDTGYNWSLSPGMCCLLCPHCGQSSP